MSISMSIFKFGYLIKFFFLFRRFKVDQFDYGQVCTRMAEKCVGMSGREISKLGVAWQAAVYASADGVLTETMVLERCEAAVQQHKQKVKHYSTYFDMDISVG